ncbi:MAG: 5'-deoxynucleotidase [Bacillota bacterium]|nr:5'-deoxynucleotidase [Bacillota bacterium]
MKKSDFFALMSRMKYISRWGLMKNTIPENIQEHSLTVAMFAHAIAVIGRDVYHKPLDPGFCAAASIYHDAPEILTGDLPTPIKYFSPEIRDAYKAVEQSSRDRMLSMLPSELRPSFEPLFDIAPPDSDIYKIIKAADRIAAYVKCVEEIKSGNREFSQAASQIKERLDEIDLPEVRYFMETFIDGFSRTLDEINK